MAKDTEEFFVAKALWIRLADQWQNEVLISMHVCDSLCLNENWPLERLIVCVSFAWTEFMCALEFSIRVTHRRARQYVKQADTRMARLLPGVTQLGTILCLTALDATAIPKSSPTI